MSRLVLLRLALAFLALAAGVAAWIVVARLLEATL